MMSTVPDDVLSCFLSFQIVLKIVKKKYLRYFFFEILTMPVHMTRFHLSQFEVQLMLVVLPGTKVKKHKSTTVQKQFTKDLDS